MPMAQLLQAASLLALCHQGAHFDWQLRAREQVRAGVINTPKVPQSNTISFTEIAIPSAQIHATFTGGQDLLLRYQPQFLDSLRWSPPARGGIPGKHVWTGLSILHRGLLTYKAGEEHALAFVGQLNLNIGKLDTGAPDSEVIDSGFLPGQLGALVNYTNINAIFALKRRMSRHVRLASQQTVGLIQFQAPQAIGYFANMPALVRGDRQGSQTQLRLLVRSELEYLLDARSSLFADLDLTDVSYQDTASFPAFAPSVGYATDLPGPGQIKVTAGFIKYWTNPLPGIFDRPGYLPTASLAWAQSLAPLGLPRLKANLLLSLAPYYNLQFSSLEPRSTVTAQLDYAVSRSWTLLATYRLLSSRYYNLRRWNTLRRGHPRNIMLASIGVRYNWRNILGFDLSAYASEQSYQKSGTMPYNQMRQAYVMVGLQGTWQRR